jgi:hypothetical protein
MPLTVTDPATLAALTASPHPVELHDPDGRVIGRFVPPIPGMTYPEFGMTDEEIERYDNDPNARWVTAEEVEARLRALRGSP